MRAAFITPLMMEAVRTSQMSVFFNYATRQYGPEGCFLHTRRREHLKSHKLLFRF
jgi:hypothetical protein